ncbi:MAG TPA: hypothetical protein VL330_19670, partial [Actinomycetes bacterium]|nr:hypothetical protein [Actinomycetes bacterium]
MAALAWALWALTLVCFALVAWLNDLLVGAGRPDLATLSSDIPAFVLATLSATTVGALLASRRPRHPVGWLLLGLGLPVALSGVATGYAYYGLMARPGALPAADWAALYHGVSILAALGALQFVLLLTPTGSLPSPRWRWWAWVAGGSTAVALATTLFLPFEPPFQATPNPLDVPGLPGLLRPVSNLAWILTTLGLPVAAGSLLLRFRRARGIERQQLRWLVLAAAVAAALLAATALALGLGLLAPTGNDVLLGWVSAVVLGLMPLATGAAILRYRLYDLDRIVSRTVAYGLLTLLLGGGYAVVVLGLGQLLGRDSSLVVAGATLAVAALFQPARRRVQRLVDRRFNRRRYDAARTIQVFSARLREQVDLDALTAELVVVADQTRQPTRVS